MRIDAVYRTLMIADQGGQTAGLVSSGLGRRAPVVRLLNAHGARSQHLVA
jgi:hypothetical protein